MKTGIVYVLKSTMELWDLGLRITNILERVFLVVTWILFKITTLFFRFRPIPEPKHPLLRTSATQLAELIRNGEVKSVEAVSVYIERQKQVNRYINAIVEDRWEEALAEARAADDFIRTYPGPREELRNKMPLLGVPITVKETCRLKGMSFACGYRRRRGVRASEDSECVALLRSAGAIPLAITNTPELCLGWETVNAITGRTLNPHGRCRTVGGSSGGEAALLTSAGSVLGVGSDIAGSVRLPAMFCGVYGHKATAGYVTGRGHFPAGADEYLVMGPMTRYAEDLALGLKVMAGPKADHLRLDESVDLSNLRIYYQPELTKAFWMHPTHLDVLVAIHKVLSIFNRIGAHVKKVKLDDLKYSMDMSTCNLLASESVPDTLQNDSGYRRSFILEMIKVFLGCSDHTFAAVVFSIIVRCNGMVPKSKRPHYEKLRDRLKQRFQELLGDNGVFILPTFQSSAFIHNQFLLKMAGTAYASTFNILGMPATHVPVGRGEDGLPVGVQVVSGPHQDRLCLAVAREIERRGIGGWVEPPYQKSS